MRDLGIDASIILNWILKSMMCKRALVSSGSRLGLNVDSFEHSNSPLSFIKCGEFIDQLRDYKLVKKYSAPRSRLL